MSQFENENKQNTETTQKKPENNEQNEKYNKPLDKRNLVEVAEHYQEYFAFKDQVTGDPFANAKLEEFDQIVYNLQKIENNPGAVTGLGTIRILNNELNSLIQQQDKVTNEVRKQRNQKTIHGLKQTIQFLTEKINCPIPPEQLEKMKKDLIAEYAKLSAEKDAETKEVENVITTPDVTVKNETNEQNTEQELRERRLIDQVLAKAGVKMNADVPSNFTPEKYGGYETMFDQKIIDPGRERTGGLDMQIHNVIGIGNMNSNTYKESRGIGAKDYFASKNISEFLYIEPVTTPVYEQRTKMVDKEVSSGFMGLGKKIVQEQAIENVQVGEKSVPTKEKIKNGDEEPCFHLVYTLTPSQDQSFKYKTINGSRAGQVCDIEMFLPQGQAEAVLRATRQDPSFIHRLIGEVAVKDIGIPQEWWNKGWAGVNAPMRPPYEKWREMTGGKSKIYALNRNEIDSDQLKQGTNEFDNKFVLEY